MKWVSKGKKKKYSIKRFFKSFGYAAKGIFSAFKTEQNLLVQLIVGIITIVLGIVLKVSTVELLVIILAIGLVMSMEFVNTSIEYVVDMAMPEIHPLAKSSKDIAASAVLFSAITAFVIGLVIFVPKVIDLFR